MPTPPTGDMACGVAEAQQPVGIPAPQPVQPDVEYEHIGPSRALIQLAKRGGGQPSPIGCHLGRSAGKSEAGRQHLSVSKQEAAPLPYAADTTRTP